MEANTKMLATEIKIQKAFIKLVTLAGFDKLTIQKLCQEAEISRGTFYLHYIDKYDLLTHYEDELVANIKEIFNRFPKPELNLLLNPPIKRIMPSFSCSNIYTVREVWLPCC